MGNKKLTRTRNSSIGGVCTGLGEYFNIEPIIIQILFFILIFTPFPIILTYILLWMFTPKED
jgi:phage shock protein PspC (stress-responsive transcriptional regulator)